jgi:hypothetical protein
LEDNLLEEERMLVEEEEHDEEDDDMTGHEPMLRHYGDQAQQIFLE